MKIHNTYVVYNGKYWKHANISAYQLNNKLKNHPGDDGNTLI
jgi:hypothetical protein